MLRDLSVVETWVWLARNFLPIRFGDTPLSRAFNSFTYLYARDLPDPFQILVALMGIEALYGSGRPGIAAQIVERTQLLLGPRSSFKGDLRRMYDLRSATIHGGFGFPPLDTPFDYPPAYKRRWKELGDAEALAGAVLVASLQELQQRGATHLNFVESVGTRAEAYDVNSSDEVGHAFVRYKSSAVEDYVIRHGPEDPLPPAA